MDDGNHLEFWAEITSNRIAENVGIGKESVTDSGEQFTSERLFRKAGNVFTVKRTSLLPEKLDDLLFLIWNKNIKDLDQKGQIAIDN